MKIVKAFEVIQCSAIVKPGEYVIDVWDNQQCTAMGYSANIRCEHCAKFFCLLVHWNVHRAICNEDRTISRFETQGD